MRELLEDLDRWRQEGQPVALATVIQTWGSSPRREGAKMAITGAGEFSGSVSAGCVESAVVEAGLEVLRSGKPQLLKFGVADETAWEVGLACGGSMEVFVQRLDLALYDSLRAGLLEDRPMATATVTRGPPDLLGSEIVLHEDGRRYGERGAGWEPMAVESARGALAEGRLQRVALGPTAPPRGQETEAVRSDPLEVFIDVMLPSPTLVAIGGVHIAICLTSLAKTVGYRTVVVDPRRAFGAPARFPHVDQLVQAWPDEALAQVGLTRSTAVAILTHDPKLDDPALKAALPSPAFYVGALGSRRTQQRRRRRLRAAGFPEAQLARLHAPIGLEIGASSPEEIALSVMAQVVAVRNEQAAQRGPAQGITHRHEAAV